MEQDTNTKNQFIRGDGFCFLNNVNAIKIAHFYHKLFMKYIKFKSHANMTL